MGKSGPKSECWLWHGARDPKNGYGNFGIEGGHNGRTEKAHRAAWLLLVGPIPDGLFVLHKCDNPPCVNPAHLFLGTHQDNMDDKIEKGRTEKQPENVVRAIRRLRAKGWHYKQLQELLGLSENCVRDILDGTNAYKGLGGGRCE